MTPFLSNGVQLGPVILMSAPARSLLMAGVILIIGLLIVFIVVRQIRNVLLRWSQSLPGALLNHLKRDIDSGEFARRLQSPVSLSAMDRIYAPQIHADFPELNLEELKQRAGRLAYATLSTIDSENLSDLNESSELYNSQVRNYLESLHSLGHCEHYADITVHRAVLADYAKQQGTCRIRFQLAIGAHYQKLDSAGQIIAGQDGINQFKFEIEAIFVQDPSLSGNQALEALAFNCPNCGAPVALLGDKTCEYCGAAIEPINIKAWTFSTFSFS